jgi:hypothetical protein
MLHEDDDSDAKRAKRMIAGKGQHGEIKVYRGGCNAEKILSAVLRRWKLS